MDHYIVRFLITPPFAIQIAVSCDFITNLQMFPAAIQISWSKILNYHFFLRLLCCFTINIIGSDVWLSVTHWRGGCNMTFEDAFEWIWEYISFASNLTLFGFSPQFAVCLYLAVLKCWNCSQLWMNHYRKFGKWSLQHTWHLWWSSLLLSCLMYSFTELSVCKE